MRTDANRVDPTSRREVLRIGHPLRDHTIGQIAFNPNAAPGGADYGMLYIGVGDGGDTFPVRHEIDSMRNAQNTRVLLGKILRINPLPADGRKYTVPADNPFVGNAKYLPEIWAYGLRNPQRFCWDTGGDRQDVHRRHRAGAGGGGQRRRGRSQLRLERARRMRSSSTVATRTSRPICRRTTRRWDSRIRRSSTGTSSAARSPAAACIAAG